jgi:hypothetical protein
VNYWARSACYPRGSFYPLSDASSTRLSSPKARTCIGSLTPAFAPARLVSLAVKHAYAFALSVRFPSEPSVPLNASVTFWEATAPVKLPTRHCSDTGSWQQLYGTQSKNINKLINVCFTSPIVANLRYRLEPSFKKGGISLVTPPRLAPRLQSLPPMLHNLRPNPMPSCSKAPRGLSVFSWVDGIFTAIAISPGPSLRQCPYRSAIRAGQNLPDKEFRLKSYSLLSG